MATVDVYINSSMYRLACDDGQEARLQELAGMIDGYVRKMGDGKVADDKLLIIMTAIMLADKLSEYDRENKELKEQINQLLEGGENETQENLEEIIVPILDGISARIEGMLEEN